MMVVSKQKLIELWRMPLCYHMKKKLKDDNFVILSSNCIGGCLLHDLGLQFTTPTVNLTINNFVEFCERHTYYLREKPKYIDMSNHGYPIFRFSGGGVQINAVHYRDIDDFYTAWERRSERFLNKISQGADIVILATDAQVSNRETERFFSLPYCKVLFTSAHLDKSIFVSKFSGWSHVGDLTKYVDVLGHRCFEKELDCVSFLNRRADRFVEGI